MNVRLDFLSIASSGCGSTIHRSVQLNSLCNQLIGRPIARKPDGQGCTRRVPPAVDGVTEGAIQQADYVLIPCRQSLFDLIGAEGVVELCRQHEKPFGFVMTDVSPDWKATNTNSAKALGELGHVFKTRLTHRESYVTALAAGKAPWEIDKVARAEIEALWGEIKKWMR
jgi:cellulose biosynthesis protein BcsQ